MEVARAVALLAYLGVAAIPTGAAMLRGLGLAPKEFRGPAERWVAAESVGLGGLAFLLTLVGLAGFFYPVVVLILPGVVAAISLPFGWQLLRIERKRPIAGPSTPLLLGGAAGLPAQRVRAGEGKAIHTLTLALSHWERELAFSFERLCGALTVLALAALLAAIVVQDLAPPTDYDGLLYHLVAPQRFLQAHRIVYLPENFSADLPTFGELLFAVGLAGGSDRAPQLMHGLAGALCIALTWLFGARCFGSRAARWAAAGLAATPLLPFLSTRAYIDLFTLLFGLLALFGLLLWLETDREGWLRLAGLAAGLALCTKYAGIALVAALGAAVVAGALFRPPCHGEAPFTRQQRLRVALRGGTWFGALAALVSAPWYARQIVALHNPVWPMYFGGRDWDAARVAQLTYFIGHYGAGRTLHDWLLLPWNLYTQSWRFGHVPDSYPPLLALAAPLSLLYWRPATRWLLGITAALCLLWVVGWQDLRFLLPAYAGLALLGAIGLQAVGSRYKVLAPIVSVSILALVVARAAGQALAAADVARVVSGAESVPAYLQEKLPDYRAISVLNAQAAPGSAALFLGDGQIWYCRERCLPDAAHDNLLMWFSRPGTPEAAAARLREAGVSHILLSKRDYWYLEHQDPEDRLRRQLADFYVFKAKYLDMVYEDDLTELYRGRW